MGALVPCIEAFEAHPFGASMAKRKTKPKKRERRTGSAAHSLTSINKKPFRCYLTDTLPARYPRTLA